MIRRDLVFDIGAHAGSDSAYYLRKGYRVVAVEADPVLAAGLAGRFAAEIDRGRYVLVAAGVAEAEGERPFWVCDDVSEWSSFDPAVAGRDGARRHAITVPTIRFRQLIETHGVPQFCKIDIEGNDRLCLRDLAQMRARPSFLSVEMAHADGGVDLRLLRDIGFTRFKLVDQVARTPALAWRRLRDGSLPPALVAAIRKYHGRLTGVRRDGDWRFPDGSSGAFGDAGPGRWRSFSATLRAWRSLHDVPDPRGHLGPWYDFHAG